MPTLLLLSFRLSGSRIGRKHRHRLKWFEPDEEDDVAIIAGLSFDCQSMSYGRFTWRIESKNYDQAIPQKVSHCRFIRSHIARSKPEIDGWQDPRPGRLEGVEDDVSQPMVTCFSPRKVPCALTAPR